MRVNLTYLKSLVNFKLNESEVKSLLVSIGIEVAEVIRHRDELLLEVEITPNRPDWLSHYGLAREIAAKLPEVRFRPLDVSDQVLKEKKAGFDIQIEDRLDCPRYSGAIVRGVEVKESNRELKGLIESFGLRPVNNLVDISNLVLFTMGQPIHIFDLDRLSGDRILVRRAKRGEVMVMLDGRRVELAEHHLMIADGRQPVALAGIMGGLQTGVTAETKNIFIESACFNPIVIRKGARLLDIQSDASYRFSRGTDIEATVEAIQLILKFIESECRKKQTVSFFHDLYPIRREPQTICLPQTFPSSYTGIEIAPPRCEQILSRLGFGLTPAGDSWEVKVPSWRVDMYGKQDLVEEIVRIQGYDQLPALIPPLTKESVHSDPNLEKTRRIKEQLVAGGFSEVINYDFLSPREHALFFRGREAVRLKNPIGAEFSVLRNSLLGGLLRNAALNLNQGSERVAFFEVGNVYDRSEDLPREDEHLGILACGRYLRENWKLKKWDYDFHIFKSQLRSLFRRFHLDFELAPIGSGYLKEGTAYALKLNGREIGRLGELIGEVLEFYQIARPVFAAELELNGMGEGIQENLFVMWNRFPASRRDFSFLIDKGIPFSDLETAIKECGPAVLESHELLDVYEGQQVPAEKVSFFMTFTYRGSDRTLTADEVNRFHQELIGRLIARLGVIPR